MNNTTHYSLRKPASDDRVLRTDFDYNWDAIDTAIHGAAVSAEAAQAAVDSEVSARQNAVTAETTARQSAITTLQTELAKCGNCKIQVGSYTGSGTYGQSNKRTLTFSAKPLALIVMHERGNDDMMFVLRPCNRGKVNAVIVEWSNTGVSWYGSGSANQQMNGDSTTYYYVAFLAVE